VAAESRAGSRADSRADSRAEFRAEVVAMLATYGERSAEEVPESIDSLELAWLIHQVEQRYGRPFEGDDDALARMTSVSGAVAVLAELGFGGAR
jgi:acyl carrier protein